MKTTTLNRGQAYQRISLGTNLLRVIIEKNLLTKEQVEDLIEQGLARTEYEFKRSGLESDYVAMEEVFDELFPSEEEEEEEKIECQYCSIIKKQGLTGKCFACGTIHEAKVEEEETEECPVCASLRTLMEGTPGLGLIGERCPSCGAEITDEDDGIQLEEEDFEETVEKSVDLDALKNLGIKPRVVTVTPSQLEDLKAGRITLEQIAGPEPIKGCGHHMHTQGPKGLGKYSKEEIEQALEGLKHLKDNPDFLSMMGLK